MPQHLHHQPRRIATRSATQRERLFGSLYARLHADQIPNLALQSLIDLNEEIVGGTPNSPQRLHQFQKLWSGRQRFEIRHQLTSQRRVVHERNCLGARLDEEIERIDHRQVGDQIDFDREAACLLREHQAREIIAVRVLLPIEKVLARLNLQRVAQNRRPTMRSRPQPHDMRLQRDQPVVAIFRLVMQCDSD